jgi:hypothetical protein
VRVAGPFLLVLLPLLAACSAPPGASALSSAGAARAVGRLNVADGPARYQVLQTPAALRPFAKAYLQHIELYLRRLDKPQQPDVLVGVVLPAAFDTPLWIDGLVPISPYRIIAKAYQPWDVAPGAPLVEAHVPASSTTDFIAGPADSVTSLDAVGGIQLVLADRAFVAHATGSFDIEFGSFESTTASEALVMTGGV